MGKLNTRKIEKLLKDMKNLEKEIRFAKAMDLRNRKPEKIRNMKKKEINLEMRKLLMPYFLTAGLVVGGLKLTGEGFPFYKDDVKKYLITDEVLGLNEQTDTVREIYREEKPMNSILYYSTWKQDENEQYFRNCIYCETNAVDLLEIIDTVDRLVLYYYGYLEHFEYDLTNPGEHHPYEVEYFYRDYSSLEEYFKNKVEDRKNTSDPLEEPLKFGNIETYREYLKYSYSIESVNNKPGFIAHLYEIDKEKFIYDKESDEQNRKATILFIALTSGGFILIGNRKEILRKMNEMQHYPYKSREQLELKLRRTRKQINKHTDKQY